MSNEKRDGIQFLSAFSPGRLSDAVKIWRICEKHGISKEELYSLAKNPPDSWNETSEGEELSRPFRRCPDCGTMANLRHIKEPHGPANRFGYRSHWFCFFCGWEEYSIESVPAQIKKFQRQDFD